jgi:hypothetical protein
MAKRNSGNSPNIISAARPPDRRPKIQIWHEAMVESWSIIISHISSHMVSWLYYIILLYYTINYYIYILYVDLYRWFESSCEWNHPIHPWNEPTDRTPACHSSTLAISHDPIEGTMTSEKNGEIRQHLPLAETAPEVCSAAGWDLGARSRISRICGSNILENDGKWLFYLFGSYIL